MFIFGGQNCLLLDLAVLVILVCPTLLSLLSPWCNPLGQVGPTAQVAKSVQVKSGLPASLVQGCRRGEVRQVRPRSCLDFGKKNAMAVAGIMAILADQLTLSQPEGADYAYQITTGTLVFSDLALPALE